MKKIFLMALMALTMIACSKEEPVFTSGDAKVVKVSIKSGALTRAVGQPLADGTKTTIHSLYVFFLDAANGNVVVGSRAITGADLDSIKAGGFEITGVNTSAKFVYIVANYTENGVDLSGVANLAAIQAKTAEMATASQDWDKALLSNSDKTDNGEISLPVNNKATATVELMPDLSRIEVKSLKALSGAPASVSVTEYSLSGVYLNGYFSEFKVGGAPAGNQAALNLTPAALATVPDWAKDVYGAPLTGETEYTASAGATADIWAYMLPSGTTPRIIFDIDDVVYDTNTPAVRNKFITVKSFKDTSGNPVTQFLRGRVYRVSTVNFLAKDTHDNPNAENIDVTVTVEVLGWIGVDVDPEL